MASFFGKAAKTKTTVAPDARVDAILKRVADLSNNMNVGDFVERGYAGFTPAQQQALQQMRDSSMLNEVQRTYQPRTEQGINQLRDVNSQLQQLANQGVSARDVANWKQGITGGNTAALVNRQAAGASLGNGESSGALRRANATGVARNAATTNLARGINAQSMGIRNMQANQDFQRGVLGQQAQMAGRNVSLGAVAPQVAQQRMQNLLNAGNANQANQQAMYNTQWQNDMGRQQFGWDQLNNRLNVLNTISPMAGYTTTTKGSAPSVGQQIAGAGIAAGGALAGRYFSPGATAARADGVGGWDSLSARGASNAQGYQMPGGSGSFLSNLGQGFGSMFSAT